MVSGFTYHTEIRIIDYKILFRFLNVNHETTILKLCFVLSGAMCDANTFDGERCVYGALTNQIRFVFITPCISLTPGYDSL